MAVLNKEDETKYNQDSSKDYKGDIENEKSPLRQRLESWLNKNMRIEMTDGRVLVGIFLCTDRDRNVILGSCAEYVVNEEVVEEPRVLGLAMVPGHHIVSIEVDNELATNTDVL